MQLPQKNTDQRLAPSTRVGSTVPGLQCLRKVQVHQAGFHGDRLAPWHPFLRVSTCQRKFGPMYNAYSLDQTADRVSRHCTWCQTIPGLSFDCWLPRALAVSQMIKFTPPSRTGQPWSSCSDCTLWSHEDSGQILVSAATDGLIVAAASSALSKVTQPRASKVRKYAKAL